MRRFSVLCCAVALAGPAFADFEVYFMRHGETPWNRAKVLQGSVAETDLTPVGVAMAEETAATLAREGVTFDRVYTSPYLRARHTAEILAKASDVKAARFKLAVRIPGWATGVKLAVNDVAVDAKRLAAGTWFTEEREWKDGDNVRFELELPVRMHRLGDSVAFTRGPVLLARDTRFADGDLSEVLRKSVLKEDPCGTFRPVRVSDPTMWMAFEAELPFGVHDENRDGRLPAAVRFCDYASAANEWRPENVCRTWFRVISDLTDVMRPYGREKSQEGRK